MKVGYGKAIITPRLGTPCLLGLDNRLVEVFDDLYVRALWLQVENEELLIVAGDIVNLESDDAEEFIAHLADGTSVPKNRIVLHSTHMHQSPSSRWGYGELLQPYGLADDFVSPEFKKTLSNGYVNAAREAIADATECVMGYGHAPVANIASNRRIPDPDNPGMVMFRQSRPPEDLRLWPEGPIDPLVRVVLFKEVNGDRLTGMCNYNCHPTATGGDGAPYATADFPGEGIRLVEQEVPGLRMLHLTGTAGEINPGKHILGNMDAITDRKADRDRCGRRYADGILRAIESLDHWREPTGLIVQNRSLKLSLQSDLPSRQAMEKRAAEEAEEYLAAKKLGETRPGAMNRLLRKARLTQLMCDGKITTRATAMCLDGILFSFMSGEIFAQFGNTLRERLGYPKLLNVAVCFGTEIGYVVPPECYSQGGYEPTATVLAPVAYNELLTEVLDLLSAVAN